MEYTTIAVERREGYVEVALNRPENRNAINHQLSDELMACLSSLDDDDTVSAVVLYGKGPVFSAGHDLYEVAGELAEGRVPKEFEFGTKTLQEKVWEIRTPIIAAVHGFLGPHAMYLMSSFDMIVATESTRFSFEQGRVSGAGCDPRMTFQIGALRHKKWRLLGEVIDASTAEQWGLINEVVAEDELLPTARSWAERLAQIPRLNARLNKLSINNQYAHFGIPAMQQHQQSFIQQGHGSETDQKFFQTVLESGLREALKTRPGAGD